MEVDAWVWPTKCIFQFLFSPIFDHFFVLRVIKIKWHASPLPPSQLRIGIGTPSGLAFHTFVAQYRTSVGTAIIINWIIYCFFAQRWASFVCTITTQRPPRVSVKNSETGSGDRWWLMGNRHGRITCENSISEWKEIADISIEGVSVRNAERRVGVRDVCESHEYLSIRVDVNYFEYKSI